MNTRENILNRLGELQHDLETLVEEASAALNLVEGLDGDADAHDLALLAQYTRSAANLAQYLPGMVDGLTTAVADWETEQQEREEEEEW